MNSRICKLVGLAVILVLAIAPVIANPASNTAYQVFGANFVLMDKTCPTGQLGMSRELLKLSGSLVHDYATISDDSPSPNRASRARRAATSASIS